MDTIKLVPRRRNSKQLNGLEAAAALYGGIRLRRRDRTGEIIDESAVHNDVRPPIERPGAPLFPEYCDHLEREAQTCRNLTQAELEARKDAASTELIKRRGIA